MEQLQDPIRRRIGAKDIDSRIARRSSPAGKDATMSPKAANATIEATPQLTSTSCPSPDGRPGRATTASTVVVEQREDGCGIWRGRSRPLREDTPDDTGRRARHP